MGRCCHAGRSTGKDRDEGLAAGHTSRRKTVRFASELAGYRRETRCHRVLQDSEREQLGEGFADERDSSGKAIGGEPDATMCGPELARARCPFGIKWGKD